MNIVFRAKAELFDQIRSDLKRRHAFAAERVGFLTCQASQIDGGMLILVAGYDPVADDDYLNDRRAAAMMGPSAIRKAMQKAYNGGAQNISIFHIHMHEHRGVPGFSSIDITENRKFVPDFFNVAPHMPHGAVVLSHDKAAAMCWLSQEHKPADISRFEIVGAPMKSWKGI